MDETIRLPMIERIITTAITGILGFGLVYLLYKFMMVPSLGDVIMNPFGAQAFLSLSLFVSGLLWNFVFPLYCWLTGRYNE